MKYVLYALIGIGIILLILSVRAGLVWYSVSRYQNYWNKLAQKPADDDAIQLVALGDSVAQGVGASNAKYSYVGRLATAIKNETGREVQVINLSKSGAKIKDVSHKQIPRLQELQLREDAIITLDIGTNDVTHGSYQKYFKEDLQELFPLLPQKTILADLPYVGKSRLQAVNPNIEAANKIFHEVAQTHNLTVVPVYDNLKAVNSLAVYSGDFFHPSNYGYQIWFDSFWPKVAQQLKQN